MALKVGVYAAAVVAYVRVYVAAVLVSRIWATR
jgi:hypothetical protein